MKKRDILHLISLLTISVVMSCAGVDESNHQSTVINVVAGYQENDPDTKTMFADGGAVIWTAGDMIKVVADDVCMTSSECTDDAMSYDFTVNGWPADKEPLYAVYCGDYSPRYDDGLYLWLDDAQEVRCENSLHANVAVGILTKKDDGAYKTQMKNACAVLRFRFAKYDDIRSVVIDDLNGNPLAGEFRVDAKENPLVNKVLDPKESVSISGAFQKGKYYCACILPGEHLFRITLIRQNGERLQVSLSEPARIERNQYVPIYDIDNFAKTVLDGVENEGFKENTNSLLLGEYIDFSRVGYHWGEEEPLYVPVGTTLEPSSGDRTSDIQNAIDNTSSGHAVLLKEGTYNVSGQLVMKSGVVLRGEGEGKTVIVATGTSRYVDPDADSKEDRVLISIGNVINNKDVENDCISPSRIITDAAVGQMYVEVADPSNFKAGDKVVVCRPGTDAWISALKMDEIPQNDAGSVIQWNEKNYDAKYTMYWSRRVVRVSGSMIYLDNPLVMELTDDYGEENRGILYKEKGNVARVSECGIENMTLRSEYAFKEYDIYANHVDEDHCWTAIQVNAAEHCWIRNVTALHFGYCMVNLWYGARYITVSDCSSKDPVSELKGSRRYAFHNYKGEMCLFTGCTADKDRHGCVTGVRTPGPNVYHDCHMTNSFSDMGPHQKWATGILYDGCTTDGLLAVQDRDNYGTGQGWSGVNFVLWNCEAASIVCQSPWVSGHNWCVGCIGEKSPSSREYGLYGQRPDGIWKSHGTKVSPQSMYEYQLRHRSQNGIMLKNKLL